MAAAPYWNPGKVHVQKQFGVWVGVWQRLNSNEIPFGIFLQDFIHELLTILFSKSVYPVTSVEAADGAKCSPRLFAHPLLPVLPCSQGSERCSGNKRGLCCQGGAVGNQSEHGSQQTGVWAFLPLLCVPCKYTQSLKPGKPHWGKAGGWRVGGGGWET